MVSEPRLSSCWPTKATRSFSLDVTKTLEPRWNVACQQVLSSPVMCATKPIALQLWPGHWSWGQACSVAW